MKTFAVIIAGGSGSRMGQDIPKQFLSVNDRPVLAYTLEAFQRHEDVDEIVVVCIKGWHDVVWAYARQFGVTKLDQVVAGGASGQESIRNGIQALEGRAADGDLVVIHDGIRPLVDEDVLTDVIAVAAEHGSAATSLPYNEQIFVVDTQDPSVTTQFVPRDALRRVSTPQAYRWPEIRDAYEEAFAKNIGVEGSHYANTMWVELGHELHLSKGSDRNIKLTTTDDFEMFRAYLSLGKSGLLK